MMWKGTLQAAIAPARRLSEMKNSLKILQINSGEPSEIRKIRTTTCYHSDTKLWYGKDDNTCIMLPNQSYLCRQLKSRNTRQQVTVNDRAMCNSNRYTFAITACPNSFIRAPKTPFHYPPDVRDLRVRLLGDNDLKRARNFPTVSQNLSRCLITFSFFIIASASGIVVRKPCAPSLTEARNQRC